MMGCGIAHFGGAASRNPWGQDFKPNFVSLGGFQTTPTKMSCTTPHHNPKYEILQKKIVNYPFKETLNIQIKIQTHIPKLTNKLSNQLKRP